MVIQATIDLVKKIAIERETDLRVIPLSIEYKPFQTLLYPVFSPENKYLGVWSREKTPLLSDPWLENQKWDRNSYFTIYPFTIENYRLLSQEIPRLRPHAGKTRRSFGTGDRLGLVSAAHLNVMKQYDVFPIIAQQSPRELTKTGRTFQSVLLDAAWGLVASGYKGKFGADADHLKNEFQLLQAVESGYSFYTLDVSERMQNHYFQCSKKELDAAYQKLSLSQLSIYKRYLDRKYSLSPEVCINFEEKILLPVLLTFYPILDYIEQMNALLDERLSDYDLEISLDEGDVETSLETHFFLSEELHHRGIDFHSLALKFPGSFEKGVEYRGDIYELQENLKQQVTIVQNIGGYRLSLHSGSDKMSIYPIFSQETQGLFHVKTSGTSWLKALETIAVADPDLFRKMYLLSRENFPENQQDYQVSIEIDSLPVDLEYIPDKKLLDFMKKDEIRQLLHISYGSILNEYRNELNRILFDYQEDHFQRVERNIENHLQALIGKKNNLS